MVRARILFFSPTGLRPGCIRHLPRAGLDCPRPAAAGNPADTQGNEAATSPEAITRMAGDPMAIQEGHHRLTSDD